MLELYYAQLKNNCVKKIISKNTKKYNEKIFDNYCEVTQYYKDLFPIKVLFQNKTVNIYAKNNKESINKNVYIVVRNVPNYEKNIDEIDNKVEPNYFNLYFDEKDKNINLETELKNAKKASVAKTNFLSSVSHDIRTPMNAIMGFTDLALNKIDDKDKVKEYLHKISISSHHLLNLVNNVLDMSKIESGNLIIQNKKCSLRELVYEIKNVFYKQFVDKKLHFDIITISLVDEEIYSDILRLKQLFINLISNAIKYTLDGGKVEFIIKQNSFSDISNFEFIVRDNGVGMNKDFLEKAFEPFSREENVNNIQGTGLGLSIVKNIVNLMNGSIKVNSSLGKGSEFIISLDFKVCEEKRIVKRLKDFEGIKILYLTDIIDHNDVFSLLTNFNIDIEKCNNPNVALIRTSSNNNYNSHYDLCIIEEDYYYNNVSNIRMIKNTNYNLPHILIRKNNNNKTMMFIDLIIEKPIMLSDFVNLFITEELKLNRIIETDHNINFLKRILVVEDNDLNREITIEILKSQGYQYEEVTNGEEALERVLNNNINYYNLILMDIQMPIMNGIECTNLIRSIDDERKEIPIIAMTANAFEEEKSEILKCGINKYVSKPINANNLLSVIKDFIN